MGEGGPELIGGKGALAVHSSTTCLPSLYSWRVRLQAAVIRQRPSTSQHEMARAIGIDITPSPAETASSIPTMYIRQLSKELRIQVR